MRVVAFLAEQALAHEDGTLYVTSGFLERVQYPSYPTTRAQLAVAVHALMPPTEVRQPHDLMVEARGVTGEVLLGPTRIPLEISPTGLKSAAGEFVVNCVLGLRDVQLREPGIYRFSVTIDGAETLELQLRAEIGPNPRRVLLNANPAAATVEERKEAIAAVTSGDLERAGQLFTQIRASHPQDADAANNLGFVRLLQHKASEALDLFDQAEHLGYTQTALLSLNRGAARYLAEQYREAYEAFAQSLGAQVTSSQNWLTLITRDTAELIFLNNLGEFLVLTLLNSLCSCLQLPGPTSCSLSPAGGGAPNGAAAAAS